MSPHPGELELAHPCFVADRKSDQCAHETKKRPLVCISQPRQLRSALSAFGEEIADSKLSRHIDDGCHTMPRDQVKQRVRELIGTLGGHSKDLTSCKGF